MALIMLFNVRLESIKEKLSVIDRLARTHRFDSVYSRKISAFSLLFGFMKMYSLGLNSLAHWASCLTQVSGIPISKQAIDQKLTRSDPACFKAVVQALLQARYQDVCLEQAAWSPFARVLVQDSTCWSMPSNLADQFPGAHSQAGKAATARLQVCYDLKAHRFHELTLQCFRDNDQKHAGAITHWAQRGDVLVRDLGYFSQHVFERLDRQGVFFVSPLHYRVALYQEKERLDLARLMRRRKRIDCQVLLGSEVKVPVRLVGFKLPDVQAQTRRRRAKKKDVRFQPDKLYLQWLGWCFYITNLPPEQVAAKRIAELYELRWHIETIFKGLKSGLHWSRMFAHRSLSYKRALTTIYLMLIYILLCWHCYRWFARQGPTISLMKFLTWYRLHYELLIQADTLEPFEPYVAAHCRYETRRKRHNYQQKAQAWL